MGMCKKDEILTEVTSLLNWIYTEPKVQYFFDFIINTIEGDYRKLKTLFDGAIFSPSVIILPENKDRLISEINNAFSIHEIRLSSTDEEVEFNYSETELVITENPQLLKIGIPI